MKTGIIKVLTAICLTVIIIYGIKICNPRDIKVSKMKVGQTWKFTINDDNPFVKAIIHYDKIIDISGKYVLYIRDGEDTLSCSKSWFVIGSEICDTCKYL